MHANTKRKRDEVAGDTVHASIFWSQYVQAKASVKLSSRPTDRISIAESANIYLIASNSLIGKLSFPMQAQGMLQAGQSYSVSLAELFKQAEL
jgi:hypothetical protein